MMEMNELSKNNESAVNILEESSNSIYKSNLEPQLPVTSDQNSTKKIGKKTKKPPGFCKTLFFCQFNKFFKKNEFLEEEMNSLPGPVCSEEILKEFDKVYKSYEDEMNKENLKKIKKNANLAKAKTSAALNIDDSTSEPLEGFNHSFTQKLGKKKSPFDSSLSESMIEINPSTNQGIIKEKRLNMDILMNSIFSIVRGKMLKAIFLNIVSTILKIMIPISMKKFLQDYKNNEPILNLLPYILISSFLSLIDGIVIEHSTKNVCGCKARTGQILRSVFYRKITKANYSFLKVTDASFINKMVLYEFEHITSMVGEIPKLVTSPITLCIAMFYIFSELQILVLIVLGVFSFCVILLNIIKRRSVRRLRAYFAQESKKSEKLNECIPNMKDVKLHSLENYYMEELKKIRKKESKDLLRLHLLDAFSDSIFGSTPLFCSILVIGAMSILDGKLNASRAFSVIFVLELLEAPLDALSNSFDRLEAYSSAKKAFQFFLEEVPEKTHMLPPVEESFPDGQIILENCNFDFVKEKEMTRLLDKMMGEDWAKLKADKEKRKKMKKMKTFGADRLRKMKTNSLIFSGNFRGDTWAYGKNKTIAEEDLKKSKKFVTLLTDISVVVKPGQKVCLVGMPGSGFSEFLLSLMNESKLSNNGVMKIKGSISYLNVRMQNFFIGSVKRNIILNAEYNKSRFSHVIRMLNINLKSLKGQEYFRILERGKNLTTHMKRKILLARWVYEKKDIYLIDDLFDDMNVMEWNMIYQRVFLGELRNKTVIFMSYTNLQIKIADHIIVFDSGRILEQGSYIDLLQDQQSELRKIVMKDNSGEDDKEVNLFSKIVEGRRKNSNVIQRSSVFSQPKKSPFSFKVTKIESEDDEEEEEKVQEKPKTLSNGLFASLKKKKVEDGWKPKIIIDDDDQESDLDLSSQRKKENSHLGTNAHKKSLNMKKLGLFSHLKKPKKAIELKIESNKKEENEASLIKSDSKKSKISFNSMNSESSEEEKEIGDIVFQLPTNIGMLSSRNRRGNFNKRKSKLNSSLLFGPLALADDEKEEEEDTPDNNLVLDGLVKNLEFMEALVPGEKIQNFGKQIEKESLNYKQAKSYLKKYMLLRGKGPLFFILILFLISSLFMVSYDLWIGFWSIKLFGEKEDSPNFYFIVYLCLSLAGTAYLIFRDVIYDHILYGSSNLVNQLVLDLVMRLKMTWFNGQSVERIIYRLTKDQSQLDIFIPKIVLKLIESNMMVFVGFVILNYIYYGILILFSLIYICVISNIFKRYLRVVMSMTHMVTQRKSEVVSIGGQTLNMCVYLRGTKNIGYLKRKFFKANDNFQKCTTHVANFSQRWIGIRLTLIATSLTFGVYCFPILVSFKRDFFFQEVWKIAFSLTWGFKTTKYLKVFLRSMSLVFINIISISRLYEYVEAKKDIEVKYGSVPEEENKTDDTSSHSQTPNNKIVPQSNVPNLKKVSQFLTKSQNQQGVQDVDRMIPLLKNLQLNDIEIINVSLTKRFRGDILHNVNMKIESGATIGLYGRSLSGIPDLLELLCGLYDRKRGENYENSNIMIHGHSIDKFDLELWRNCFVYLKEEPLVMSGKVRNNIDPVGKFSDDDLVRALDIFKLNELINIQRQSSARSNIEEGKKIDNSSIRVDSAKLEEIIEEDDEIIESNSFFPEQNEVNERKFSLNRKMMTPLERQNIQGFASPKIIQRKGQILPPKKSRSLLNPEEKESTTYIERKKGKNIDIMERDNKLRISLNNVSTPPPDPNSQRKGDDETPAFGQNFNFQKMNNFNSSERFSKTMEKERTPQPDVIDLRTDSDISGIKNTSPKSTYTSQKKQGVKFTQNHLSPDLGKRRHSAYPNPLPIRIFSKKEPENINPGNIFKNDGSPSSRHRSSIDDKSITLQSEFGDKNKPKILRENLQNHVVSTQNRENIEDFLEYEILPKAGNLTIGLKKIIMLAKAFLEEPNFIILEENALDFDELDNSYFFNILNSMKSTVLMSMCTMNFLMGFDQIYILEKGKIVEKGKPVKLLMDNESILHSEVEEVAPKIIKKLKRKTKHLKRDKRPSDNPFLSLLNRNNANKKTTKGKA